MNITKEEVQELLDAFHADPLYADWDGAVSLLREKLAEKDDGEPVTAQAAAIRTLTFLGYTYHGAEQWKPPLGKTPEPVAWIAKQEDGGLLLWDASYKLIQEGYEFNKHKRLKYYPLYLGKS
jgi:hypothetical protein